MPGSLHELQRRIADFPEPLGCAMAAHLLVRTVTPWRALTQIVQRDATLWCRELQVQPGYRRLGALAGLDGLYFTTFQLKRMQRLVGRMARTPRDCAARIEAALSGDIARGCAELHALEGEVTALVAARWPELDSRQHASATRRLPARTEFERIAIRPDRGSLRGFSSIFCATPPKSGVKSVIPPNAVLTCWLWFPAKS